jgi:hypothetical protein
MTGMTVVAGTGVPAGEIHIPVTLEDVDPELVAFLLVAGGCTVDLKRLPNGRDILQVQKASARPAVAAPPEYVLSSVAGSRNLNRRAPPTISAGVFELGDFAEWMGTRLGCRFSVDPKISSRKFVVLAPIRDLDPFLVEELLRAHHFVLEEVPHAGGNAEVRIKEIKPPETARLQGPSSE